MANGQKITFEDDKQNDKPIDVSPLNPLPTRDGSLPRTAFGELSVAEPTPVVQVSAKYGLTDEMLQINSAGGTSNAANSLFSVSTGTNALAIASINTLKQLAYRPGQGALCRITALFSDGVVNSLQAAGLITSEDALAFGYLGVDFGILFSKGGRVEAQELTITTPAGGAEATTITIDGTGFTVNLTAGTAVHNAVEIAASLTSQLPNYLFTSNEDTVFAMDRIPGPRGSFAFSSPGAAVAAWVQVTGGVEPVITVVKQTDWNQNTATFLNPQKGNVYSISIQYLGFGNISFFVEDPETGLPLLVHILKYANANITPVVGNPTFRLGWLARNLGNTTNLVVSGASTAGFVEGKKIADNSARGQNITATSVGLTAINLITVRNRFHFGGRINRAEILPKLLSLGTDSAKGAVFQLIANATLAGDAEFHYQDEANSIAEFTLDKVNVSGGRVLATFYVSANGLVPSLDDIKTVILPDDQLTLSAAVVATPTSLMLGSAVWIEDL